MKNTEILKKAIDKAIKNGFPARVDSIGDKEGHIATYMAKINGNEYIVPIMAVVDNDLYWLIFDHSFAKAFFGENKDVCQICGGFLEIAGGTLMCMDCQNIDRFLYYWQYHLQQMVLQEDPIKYLEQFL